jgi:hypothetical protein
MLFEKKIHQIIAGKTVIFEILVESLETLKTDPDFLSFAQSFNSDNSYPLKSLSNTKKEQWLGVRFLLFQWCQKNLNKEVFQGHWNDPHTFLLSHFIHFSFSHKHSFVSCALSYSPCFDRWTPKIAIDLETTLITTKLAHYLLNRLAPEIESSSLKKMKNLRRHDWRCWVTLLFSAKECFYKLKPTPLSEIRIEFNYQNQTFSSENLNGEYFHLKFCHTKNDHYWVTWAYELVQGPRES